MKLKISTIVITILAFLLALVELILILKFNIFDDFFNKGFALYLFGIVGLLFVLFGLIAPKFTFNLCYNITEKLLRKDTDLDFDYDTSYRNMPKFLLGLSIVS